VSEPVTTKLWTINECAAFFQVHPVSIRRWTKRGSDGSPPLPCVRMGSRVLRFDPQRVLTWAAERRAE
jgi:hypothetical protein